MDLKVTLLILYFMVARSCEGDSNNETLVEAIIGGQPAKIKDFPFLVSINFILSHYRYDHSCCGFLLTPSWVGTAAHCIVLKTKGGKATTTYRTTLFFLIAGTADREKLDSLYQLRFPEYLVPHPDFKWPYLYNDVGLIKVRRPFSFNENMGLATFPLNSFSVDAWETCVVAGWGITEMNVTSTKLLFSDLNILPSDLCSWSVGNSFYLNPKGTICTISTKKRTPCKGDSGSPLLCDVPDAEGDVLAPDLIEFWRKEGYSPNSGQRKVIGIVSWGLSCNMLEPGIPTMFTNISHYTSWMREVVHNSSSSLYCMRLILLLISAVHLQIHCDCQSILPFGKIPI